jgi:sensor histidine kinase regulating citrate/malate metabolism
LILALFAYLSSNKYRSIKQVAVVPTKLKLLTLICFWVSGLFCVFMYLGVSSIEYSKITVAIFIISTVVMGLVGVLSPMIIIYGLSRERHRALSKTFEVQARAQAKQCELIIKSNEDLRRYKHDQDNFNIGLKSLLKENNIKEALKMIENCDEKIRNSKRNPYKTNNTIVDALLYSKQQQAEKFNTRIKFEGKIPPSGIDIEDLCIMFGVPIDNAIEACEKLDKDRIKVISVYAHPVKSVCLRISITNPVADNVNIIDNCVKTTKEDKLNHGIGLSSLKQSVEKHNGLLKISCENNVFGVTITLFSWL